MKTITFKEAIEKIESAESISEQELKKLVSERLRSLVSYAMKQSPFFARHYAEIDLDSFTLADLPPLSRRDIQDNYEGCLTDRSLTKSEINDYLHDDGYKSGLLKGEYSVLTTSGSTGEPLLMVRDSYHNTIHAALMQKRLLRGLDPTLLSPKHHRIASVICTEGHVSSYLSFLKMQSANPDYVHNMKAISVFKPIETIVKELNEFMPDVLTGYPNMIEQLALAKSRGELRIEPKMIATSAERLSHETFLLLRESFAVPILNNYCSTEGGEIAMSCCEGHLHLNSDWILVEPIDEMGSAVEAGVVSSKVLITDLTNYVLPIIRYEVDDRVCIYHGCKCGSRFPYMDIEGRVLENITINQVNVPTAPIAISMVSISGLLNWQLIQQSEKLFDFRCLFSDGADKVKLTKQIESIMLDFLNRNGSEGAELIVSEKEFIKNAQGGKVKNILNLC